MKRVAFFRGLLSEGACLRNLGRQFFYLRHNPSLLRERRQRNQLIEERRLRQGAVPTGSTRRDLAQQCAAFVRLEIGEQEAAIEARFIGAERRETVRTDHAGFCFAQYRHGTFPREHDVQDEVTGLHPKHALIAKLQAGDRRLVKHAFAVGSNADLSIRLVWHRIERTRHGSKHVTESHPWPRLAHAPCFASRPWMFPMICVMRCSFFKMLAASSSGGRWVMSFFPRGLVRSRLQPLASTSVAGTFHA